MAHDTKKGQAAIRHALETGGSGLRSRSRTEGSGTATPRKKAGVRGRSRTEGSNEPKILGSQRRVWKRPGGRVAGSPKVAQDSAAPTASAAQLKRLTKALMDIFGQG